MAFMEGMKNDQTLLEKIGNLERSEIIKSLEENNGVISRAALKLGITERMIYYKMKKYGIRRTDVLRKQ